MEMKLYEIADQYRDVLRSLGDTDFPAEAVEDTLEALRGDFADKAWNVAAVLLHLEGEAELIRRAEERMSRRRKALEQRSLGLRRYLRIQMERTGMGELRSPQFILRVKSNPPKVVIDSEGFVPEKFKRVETQIRIDKAAIREAIAAGEAVAGAHLEQEQHLEIV